MKLARMHKQKVHPTQLASYPLHKTSQLMAVMESLTLLPLKTPKQVQERHRSNLLLSEERDRVLGFLEAVAGTTALEWSQDP